MKHFKLLAGAAAMAMATTSMPAQALTFVLSPAAGAAGAGVAPGTQARRGFEIAAAYWSSVISSNVTMNLTIGYATLGTGILGSTGSTTAAVYNAPVYAALAANQTSTVDTTAVANLRPLGGGTGGSLSFVANVLNAAGNGYLDTATRIDNDQSANNRGVQLNTSIAKALGITTNFQGTAINYALADGSVTFSDAFVWDFDPTDGIASNAFDFIGVAIHEIGHALGFRSGVDSIDRQTGPNGPNATAGTQENFVNIATVLDYYRYGSAGQLDWSTQNNPYFSIDGGQNQLFGDSRFSTGQYNGDGRQASHFKDAAAGVPQVGVMDPTSGRGQMQEVTALDIAAFDAIGWTMSFDALQNSGYRYTTNDIYRQFNATAVPEASTWMMMILGFGAIGFGMRRRDQKVAVTYA